MENEEKKLQNSVGEMNRRRETMPDGKRYIIFYTFENENRDNGAPETGASVAVENEVKQNV